MKDTLTARVQLSGAELDALAARNQRETTRRRRDEIAAVNAALRACGYSEIGSLVPLCLPRSRRTGGVRSRRAYLHGGTLWE